MDGINQPRSLEELNQLLERLAWLRKLVKEAEAEISKQLAEVGISLAPAQAVKQMESAAVTFAKRCPHRVFGSGTTHSVGSVTLKRANSPGALNYPEGRAQVASCLAKRAGISQDLRGELDGVSLATLLSVSVDVNAAALLKDVRAGRVPEQTLLGFGIEFNQDDSITLK